MTTVPPVTSRKATWIQFFRFGVVGVINTGVDLSVLNIETILTGIKEGVGFAVQKALSFGVAVTVSYFLNKHWTFGNTSSTGQTRQYSRFIVVSIVGALINVSTATVMATNVKVLVNRLLAMDALTDQLWVNIAALGGTATGLLWNFLGYKLLVFNRNSRDRS